MDFGSFLVESWVFESIFELFWEDFETSETVFGLFGVVLVRENVSF